MIHPRILKQSQGEFNKHHGDKLHFPDFERNLESQNSIGRKGMVHLIQPTLYITLALPVPTTASWMMSRKLQSISTALYSLTKPVQVNQAWLPLCESMLTAPDHAFVPHVPGNGFQDWFFHYLPRVHGETVQAVVFWFFFQEHKGLLGIWEKFGFLDYVGFSQPKIPDNTRGGCSVAQHQRSHLGRLFPDKRLPKNFHTVINAEHICVFWRAPSKKIYYFPSRSKWPVIQTHGHISHYTVFSWNSIKIFPFITSCTSESCNSPATVQKIQN